MTTIVINENIAEGRQLIEQVRAMQAASSKAVVRIFGRRKRSFDPIAGVPCTREQLLDSIEQSRNEIRVGAGIPNAELFAQLQHEVATWK